MRITGLATGLDTEALVETLLAVERRPMVQMMERKDALQQQRDAWRDINGRLNTLRERMADLRRSGMYAGRSATSSAEDIVTASAANRTPTGRYEISVTELAAAHRVRSNQHMVPAEEGLGFAGTSRINGVEITLAADDTLADVAREINNSEAKVTAVIVDGHLVVEADETGVDNEITFDDEGGIWTSLGLVAADGDGFAIQHELQAAQDAVLSVQGIEVSSASNVVSDVLDGVTFTLHDTGRAIVEIAQDDDAVVSAVRAFVDQYNSAQSFMRDKASERELLQGDGLLMRIQSNLRTDMTGAVHGGAAGEFNQLAAVGISVDRHGHMSLDEGKLRSALAENIEGVQRLFAATADEDGFDGVAVRLENRFQGWLESGTGLLAERQKMVGNRLEAIDQSMERLETRLEIRERSLMRQFAALEEVMAAFQTQGMWLEGQLQQLSGWSGSGGARG